MLNLINKAMGTNINANHEPARAGDVRHSLADISRIQKDLGYKILVPLGDGIVKTVEYFSEVTA